MLALIDVDGHLTAQEVPEPTPNPDELVIAVHTAGVNRADLVQRAGRYPPPPGASTILGLEASGTVVHPAGPYKIGDEVTALLAGGGYAERVAVHHSCALPRPTELGLQAAAALPEVWATVVQNLGQVQAGQRVLIHAGGSGIGTAAVQWCALKGALSFVTAGSQAKIDAAKSLGASGGANRHDGWLEAVRAFAPDGVDWILDPVGASYLADNQRVLGLDGRMQLIGLLSGRKAELDLGRMLMKRQVLAGSTLRAQAVPIKAAIMKQLREVVWPEVGQRVQPVVETVLPWHEADAAHTLLEAGGAIGKVLLQVDGNAGVVSDC